MRHYSFACLSLVLILGESLIALSMAYERSGDGPNSVSYRAAVRPCPDGRERTRGTGED